MLEEIKYNYIIYHGNCFDGFAGFYLFMKTDKWTPKPIVYPDQPYAKNVPPNIKNKNVIIIDVAYKLDILLEIMNQANNVLFIDHHITLHDDIKNLIIKPPHKVIYDENYSGASLVWKYFFNHTHKMPKFIKYIEDNDIGKWQYSETLSFMAGLEVHYTTEPTYDNLKKWDKLLDDKYLTNLIESGKKYEIYKNYLINKIANKYSIGKFPSEKIFNMFPNNFDKIGQYSVAIINSHCPSVSLLGKKIAENTNVGFVVLWNYIIEKKKYIISLRSKQIDVGKIARFFGGGGHKYASNFTLK